MKRTHNHSVQSQLGGILNEHRKNYHNYIMRLMGEISQLCDEHILRGFACGLVDNLEEVNEKGGEE